MLIVPFENKIKECTKETRIGVENSFWKNIKQLQISNTAAPQMTTHPTKNGELLKESAKKLKSTNRYGIQPMKLSGLLC